MNGIINDVDSLQKFRNEMLDVVEDLQKQLKKTEGVIEDISKTWKDSQFVKFKENFDDDKELIMPLCKNIEEFENDILHPLENVLREYLSL